MPMEKDAQNTSVPIEKPKFSKDLVIADAARFYPEVIEVFMDYGLHCIGCHISGFETIEEGAMGHGISGDELDNMLADAQDKIDSVAQK